MASINTNTPASPAKAQAVRLLRKYDALREELRQCEAALNAACRAYSREQGYLMYGITKDKLRVNLMVEAEQRQKQRRQA